MFEHMFVYTARTGVRVNYMPGRPSREDICPCSSYKLQLYVQEIQMSMSCKPLGLHNKFTELYKLHKIFKKFFIFLVILRIDFFENL